METIPKFKLNLVEAEMAKDAFGIPEWRQVELLDDVMRTGIASGKSVKAVLEYGATQVDSLEELVFLAYHVGAYKMFDAKKFLGAMSKEEASRLVKEIREEAQKQKGKEKGGVPDDTII